MENIAVSIANLSLYNSIMPSHSLAPFSCSIQFGQACLQNMEAIAGLLTLT